MTYIAVYLAWDKTAVGPVFGSAEKCMVRGDDLGKVSTSNTLGMTDSSLYATWDI